MKRFLRAAASHWRGIISIIIIATLAVLTLSLKLNTLIPGQNQFETATISSLNQAPEPWVRSVNTTYLLPAYYMGKLVHDPLLGARLTSVIFCLLATACFFYVIKLWFNIRIATIGSLLFITSSWLLTIAHQGAPFSLLVLSPLLILTPLAWYLKTKNHHSMAFYLLAAGIAVAVYTPYMIWLAAIVLTILVIREKSRLASMKSRHIIIASAIYFLLLLPLCASLLSHPGQIKELLGIPLEIVGVKQYFANLFYGFSMIFLIAPAQPELHLARLPMINFFETAMFVLGVYYFLERKSSKRSLIVFASSIIFLLFLPLSPTFQLQAAILLPFVYVFILAGIVELLNQWFASFPRNPLLRSLGIIMVVVTIGFSCFYHLQRFYIAWPNASETKTSYVVKSN
jgi:hypothetical protein